MQDSAILALADGTLMQGTAIGATGQSVGEVVFNTALTGYQEILTDPSYARQLVTLTYPHIGNTGMNRADEEAAQIFCGGLIVRDVPRRHSSHRAQASLSDYLREREVVAIAGLDTRRLTRHLRSTGAQAGCIAAGSGLDSEAALAAARAFPGLAGMDLAKEVSTTERYEWRQGTWQLETELPELRPQAELPYHIVAYDFGVKRNILRMLVDRGARLTVVPAQTSAQEVLALSPDGVFLSNGPGDPEPCDYAIAAIRTLIATGVPIFGICLGHQLLALAAGAQTQKMKFGHHGANHPVKDCENNKVVITSQNHGFAVDESSLPEHLVATHHSLFDGTLQGIRHRQSPAFGFQGHPEASPGPQDLSYLFDNFIAQVARHKGV